ncbi:MAG: methyltransferase domain-containing protein [Nanoarchaeota archaeon]
MEYSSQPKRFVTKVFRFKKSGSVLDLGAGGGRNSLFFAKKGFSIDVVDFSSKALNTIKEKNNNYKCNIAYYKENITKFRFRKKYDIIICTYVLHFLNKDNIKIMIKKMKLNTAKNGINIISVFTKDNKIHGFSHLFEQDELKDFYKDWKVLDYKNHITRKGYKAIYLIAKKV